MTDRELLEYAAKAAGIELIGYADHLNSKRCSAYMTINGGWNPLEDDGDALRLAVELKIAVDISVSKTFINGPDEFEGQMVEERHCDDPYAATRRAIVRAAAEIGKTK